MLLLTLPAAVQAQSAGLTSATLSLPGPGALNYLPVEMIGRIGADRAEGLRLTLRFFSGGPLAVRDLLEGRSEFAVLGAPALADFAVAGAPVVSVAAISRLPAFVLMVSTRLKGSVREVADLRGRVIGINSSVLGARSTSQQMAEHVLRQAGIDPQREVNFLAAGQTLPEQRAALQSGAVDALMGDEPFATLLKAEGTAYFLLDLHSERAAHALLGGDFLYAQLATRRDVLNDQPDKVRRAVRALDRTLRWLAAEAPERVVERLQPADELRAALLSALRRNRGIFNPDAAFRRGQIVTAAAFFRANQADGARRVRFDLAEMIDARYAGMV
ncbi:MAG: ABC transporter substrate-binding protein [Burkholderiaceae bacterium]|nr:ABC transporter substrate-binding protein [Burkholderiaceae bacterium]